MIGSLSHLISGAAIDALLDGTEKITKAHLEAIRLDHAAETTPAAPATLDQLGVTRDKVREASTRLFEPVLLVDGEGRERRIVGDGEAEHAVIDARRMAARRGQSSFRSEHLLFCLAIDPGSAARRVLNDLGVDVTRIKKELEEWLGPVQRRQRRIGKSKWTGRACSFCGCNDLGRLVAGPGVWICGDCVQTSLEILRSEQRGLRTE